MKTSFKQILLAAALVCALAVTTASAQPTAQEHVGALKASLAASHAALTHYTWIESTAVSFKGEEKSRKIASCSYGADGQVVKVPVSAPPPPAEKRGVRGKVIANKKEEMTAYMQQAVALVKTYVPPQPVKIQAAKDAGQVSVDMLEPGKRVRLNIRNYEKPGDTLAVEMDPSANRLLGLSVQTYLEDQADAISLVAQMATLPDGSTYTAAITLEAPAKKIQVTVGNSNYQKKG